MSKDLSHMDFEHGIAYNVLKQVRQKEKELHLPVPTLMPVWCCKIFPRDSKVILSFTKNVITPIDNTNFLHVKRLNKIVDDGKVKLEVIVCAKSVYETNQELFNALQEFSKEVGSQLELTLDDIRLNDIPSAAPSTKELSLEWSDKYWPIAWKGNPNLQFLKQVSFDIDKEQRLIDKLLDGLEERSHTDTIPTATLIVDNQNNHQVLSFDGRYNHPLDHSVMAGIQRVADIEKERRLVNNEIIDHNSNYLMNNFTIYTTHEPCIMCCMALVHSRIERLIYLKPNRNGGLESNYQLGDRDGLNWKFEIWKWINDKDLQRLDTIEGKFNININTHEFNA